MKQRTWLPVAAPVLNGNEKRYVADCIDSGWISSHGKYIQLFEENFAAFCGTSYAVACCNGTAALHLALLALGTGPGDEILVPTLTFISTANAVRYCGAKPVFIDSEPETMNLDTSQLEERLSPRTKGIIVVHLYGHPVDMDAVNSFARQHNLFVIEDAAEAHGAQYKGTPVGSLSDAATFSFFGNKIITTGEGGMITTNREDLRDRLKMLRGQGMDPTRRYWFPIVGYNYRMTNIQAALGCAQLENIQFHLESRSLIAAWYSAALHPLGAFLSSPRTEPYAKHAHWAYPVVLSQHTTLERSVLMDALATDQIETRPVFLPLHTMPPYRTVNEEHPVAEFLGERGILLPMHGHLGEEDIEYISSRLEYHLHRNRTTVG